MSDDRTPDLRAYGYAPGGYMCMCQYCEDSFAGDKRSVTCRTCAEKHAAERPIEQRPSNERGYRTDPEMVEWLWRWLDRMASGQLTVAECLSVLTYHPDTPPWVTKRSGEPLRRAHETSERRRVVLSGAILKEGELYR